VVKEMNDSMKEILPQTMHPLLSLFLTFDKSHGKKLTNVCFRSLIGCRMLPGYRRTRLFDHASCERTVRQYVSYDEKVRPDSATNR
jgi:hypothetical protein